MTALEIAVQDPEGIAIAVSVGADRIELCSALALGGITPSAGLLANAVSAGASVHVLIRPRGGDFCYSTADIRMMIDDVRRSVDAGAEGVVIGATKGKAIDIPFVTEVRRVSPQATITFHRAFDVLGASPALLEILIDLGADRILTSGGQRTAIGGLQRLRELVDSAAGRIEIMAGGGVVPSLVPSLIAAGVDAVHASARTANTITSAANVPLDLGQADRTDVDMVRQLRRLVI